MTAPAPVAPIALLDPADFEQALPGLAELLAATVADGASLGFHAPFGPAEAADWWRTQRAELAAGDLLLWRASGPGGCAGTVSLRLTRKPNGRHRAELVKLMVHPAARRQGLAARLLATAEAAAAERGITLLVLDTEAGSGAEGLYRAAGWTGFGTVPGYATDPAGVPHDGSFYYKQLS
ncbi:GNAT family N-acetyltransferase [Kitasatospora viridis]|uniref:Acetyltransferase (GNAT) family protein n=1 Tax=Kitasatospora viridis TaxID=281105 RepID=A0A561UBR9_9ACTN|nr:GNAT family N-acetyltransferase [Kitasatospora viridis]TWF96813.1 acetyltransferase (GNAT) family protein [Kitasatospora viridis]